MRPELRHGVLPGIMLHHIGDQVNRGIVVSSEAAGSIWSLRADIVSFCQQSVADGVAAVQASVGARTPRSRISNHREHAAEASALQCGAARRRDLNSLTLPQQPLTLITRLNYDVPPKATTIG